MKKRKVTKITAASIIAGALMSCSFVPQDNEPEDVYGPPVEEVEVPEESQQPVETPKEGYQSSENIEPPVYGPPEDDQYPSDGNVLPDEEYDPAENEPEDVYGPPND